MVRIGKHQEHVIIEHRLGVIKKDPMLGEISWLSLDPTRTPRVEDSTGAFALGIRDECGTPLPDSGLARPGQDRPWSAKREVADGRPKQQPPCL